MLIYVYRITILLCQEFLLWMPYTLIISAWYHCRNFYNKHSGHHKNRSQSHDSFHNNQPDCSTNAHTTIKNPGSRTPILFLPGFFHLSPVTHLLKKRLATDQFTTIFTLNTFPCKLSVTEQTQMVRREVEQILQNTRAKQLDIIGLGIGGLIARYYIQIRNGHHHTRRLIMIGCPNKGSYLAYLFRKNSPLHELLPGSPLMVKLKNSESKLLAIKAVSIYSNKDEMIIPYFSSPLESCSENFCIPFKGHLQLMYSLQTYIKILRSLLL